ncbi:MAG TPA: DEAD/DEAH box helicase [Allosphingosinicella sp.]|jgi:ATP-dependent Lhr-like helicase
MTSPPSSSEGLATFDRLHPEVRRWIRDEGWTELRDIQDRAIAEILDHEDDVIIAAATAAGKTEAAFLPLLTKVAGRREPGLDILYVSPLKALINDQFRRLDLLCERMEVAVVRWHGDAPQGAKRRTIADPRGIALITPESIEALFIRRPSDAYRLLGSLDAIVIDELHAFLQGPRGLHLASLLQRIDAAAGRRCRRVALSATIGDFSAAKAWLNPRCPDDVRLLEAAGKGAELRLQIRGYVEPPEESGSDQLEDEGTSDALSRIADHMFATLRGSNNLVFAGSRRTVEALSDRLRRRSEKAGVPEEFFPHHGSLSKELREDLERRLKAGNLPTTAVATTTLELGIDLGSVKSVAQVGAPRSLASLRQRLGRSGRRRGTPAVLRIYQREKYLIGDDDVLDRLRLGTVRAVAAVRLLLRNFVEPPVGDPSLLTVALHQVLSIIAEEGGARAERLYALICQPGPFAALDRSDFVALLRCAAAEEAELIEQAPDGTIMLGRMGERLVAGKDFYAVFETDEEWRLVAGGTALGTLPIVNVLGVGSIVGFAGRRWRVTGVDDLAKVLDVVPHPAGRVPVFDRLSSEPLHDRLVAEMFATYQKVDIPAYLDPVAREMLAEGRAAFGERDLGRQRVIESGRNVHVLLWRGTAINSIAAVILICAGFECEAHDMGLTVLDAEIETVRSFLDGLAGIPPPEVVAQFAENLRTAKYDSYLSDDLLRRAWVKRNEGLWPNVEAALLSVSNPSRAGPPSP